MCIERPRRNEILHNLDFQLTEITCASFPLSEEHRRPSSSAGLHTFDVVDRLIDRLIGKRILDSAYLTGSPSNKSKVKHFVKVTLIKLVIKYYLVPDPSKHQPRRSGIWGAVNLPAD